MLNYYRKYLCLVLSIMLLTITLSPTANAYSPNIDIQSKAGILIDEATGEILFEKNIHEKLYPASMTKIMTLLLAMEAIESGKVKFTDQTTISRNATRMGGSQLWMEEGETKTIEELIKAVAVASANDGAVALGEAIEGTLEGFVERMNSRAKELGMNNTNFMNPHGLHHDEHYTTPYDVSIMSRELLKHHEIDKWLTIWTDTLVVGKKNQKTMELTNHNKLIRFYDGATGIKTGYTGPAKHNVSASAKRGDTSFIAVIMCGPTSSDRFDDARKLLDYGFANYQTKRIIQPNEILGEIEVVKGNVGKIKAVAKEGFPYLVKKGKDVNIEKDIILIDKVLPPFNQGEKVGEVIIKINNEEVGRVDLIADKDVEKIGLLQLLKRNFVRILNKI